MDKFNKLLKISNILIGENGCEWDRKQTFESLKNYFVDEVYELLDAINEKDDSHIAEELGDLLHLIIFLSNIARNENKFSLENVIENITDKLVRRHPHIFSNKKVNSIEEIIQNWEEIKPKEKNKTKRKNFIDRLPKSMPVFRKAQKIIKVLNSKKLLENYNEKLNEKDLEDQLFNLIVKAENSKLDIEKILMNKLKILVSQKL